MKTILKCLSIKTEHFFDGFYPLYTEEFKIFPMK